MWILRLVDRLCHGDRLRVRCHDGRVAYACGWVGEAVGGDGHVLALSLVRFLQATPYTTKKYCIFKTKPRAPNKLMIWLVRKAAFSQ